VVSGDLVELAAVFVEAQPPALALRVVILDVPGDHGADARIGVRDLGGEELDEALPSSGAGVTHGSRESFDRPASGHQELLRGRAEPPATAVEEAAEPRKSALF
jgi:hypothetical protein